MHVGSLLHRQATSGPTSGPFEDPPKRYRPGERNPWIGEESMDLMFPLTYDFSFSAYAKKNH